MSLVGNGDFTITSGVEPFTLAPSATNEVIVQFGPISKGAKSSILRFLSNDPDENPFDVLLSGNGTSDPDILPISAFSADTTSGIRPLTVHFADSSSGVINTWQWDFGDNQGSAEQNPAHTYNRADTFTVSLTVTGPGGSDTSVRENYIYVREPSGIEVLSGRVPTTYLFRQNYPNPFNPVTQISFSVPKPSRIKILVYDANGRLIDSLYNDKIQTGEHTIKWDASHLPSGMYFIKLFTDDFQQTRKCLLLK
ncbi:MAG: T9SS type A sorting domain-containing protein [Tissierellales bacterium]|nr:T9SS type A sorting domain-containing protein [Tissierellales bacterium]